MCVQYQKWCLTFRSGVLIFFLSIPLVANAGAFEQLFAPKAELWDVWQAHNNNSSKQIKHNSWDLFLQNNIKQGGDGINRLDYGAISNEDRNRLNSYIAAMQKINIDDYHQDEQLAYWINLYNAVTVDIILKHYPVKSIRDIDISPGFFSDGPWGKKVLNINNQELSLNDVEHRILRPIWKDARIHFAVNCASLGCPNLNRQAFVADKLEAQFDTAAREFIAHPRGVKITEEGVVVSSIFSWFQQDFGETEADVIKYIQRYANENIVESLRDIKFFHDDDYDWSLNDVQVSTH